MVSLCVYLPSLSESDFPGKSLQLAYGLVTQYPTTELYAMQLLLSPLNNLSSNRILASTITMGASPSTEVWVTKHNYHSKTQCSSILAV